MNTTEITSFYTRLETIIDTYESPDDLKRIRSFLQKRFEGRKPAEFSQLNHLKERMIQKGISSQEETLQYIRKLLEQLFPKYIGENVAQLSHGKLVELSKDKAAASLKGLSFKNEFFKDTQLVPVFEVFNRLEEICLKGCHSLTNEFFTLIKSSLSHVQRLYLIDCHFTDEALTIVSCLDLTELSLNSCLNFTSVGISEVVCSLQKLTKLDLSFSYITTYHLANILRACTQLKELNLSFCQKLDWLSLIPLLVGIEKLDLSHCVINDQVLEALIKCSKLKELNLNRSLGMTKRGLEEFISKRPDVQIKSEATVS